MGFRTHTLLIAVGLALFAGQVSATELALVQVGSIKGSVAVNQGGRTVALTSGATLSPGDRLVSMENGQAQLKYADGCVVQIQPNAVATVGSKSPCAASGLVKSSSPMQFGDDAWEIPIRFLAVALVVWGVFEASDDGNSPLSP